MKKRKTVVHVVNSNAFSGLEKVACDIINNLSDDYDMIYVTREGQILESLKERKINYFIIKKLNTKEIRRMIKELNPDIIHAHDYTATVICSLVNTKIPIISHLHNNSPWLKKLCPNSLAMLYAGLRVKQILIVSDSIKNEYIFSKFISKKMLTIGNPVSRKSILDKVDKKDYIKKHDICCVARLIEQKNPQLFLNIISKLRKKKLDIKVVWVGQGEILNECINLSKKLNISKNIDFVGFQKNPYKYMASSKIFMLTSKWEGYGLVAFEALSLGLPCIVSNVGGLPDIVDNKCGKLCNNEEEYINIIEKLLKNNNKYSEYSEQAKIKAQKLDNFEEYMENIENLYNIF